MYYFTHWVQVLGSCMSFDNFVSECYTDGGANGTAATLPLVRLNYCCLPLLYLYGHVYLWLSNTDCIDFWDRLIIFVYFKLTLAFRTRFFKFFFYFFFLHWTLIHFSIEPVSSFSRGNVTEEAIIKQRTSTWTLLKPNPLLWGLSDIVPAQAVKRSTTWGGSGKCYFCGTVQWRPAEQSNNSVLSVSTI